MNFTNLQIQTENLPKVEGLVLKPISKSYFKIIMLNKLAIYAGLIGLVFGLKYVIEKKEEVQLNLYYMLSAVVVFCIFNFIVSFV